MKKILIILGLILLTPLFMSIRKVNAIPLEIYDYAEYLYGDCMVNITIELGVGTELDTFTIEIPDLSHNTNNAILTNYSHINVKNYDGELLFTTNLSNFIDVEQGGIVELDMKNIIGEYRIDIFINQDFPIETPPSATYLDDFETATTISYTYPDLLYIYYFDITGAVYAIDRTYNNIFIAPTTTLIVENYLFINWQTKTGEIFLFDGVLNEDWVDTFPSGTRYIKLYSHYISTAPILDDVDEPINTAPNFITNTLSVFNANNSTGYSVFYALVSIILIIIVVWFSWGIMAGFFIHLMFTIMCLLMGVLPTFIIAIMFIIYSIIIIYIIKNPSGSQEEI